MSHPILERHLERRSLRPLYLFYGEEEFLKERAWRRLEAVLQEQTGEAPLKIINDSQEMGLEDFLAQGRVAPLWGSGQLLILRRVDAYPAKALKAIPAYREHPSPRCWVIMMAGGLKAREVGKHPIWGPLHREEAALGFWRLKEGELYQWLTQEARQLGETLTLAAAQRLVEMAGMNLAELTQELAKLVLFAGAEKTLTPQLRAQLASHHRAYELSA